MVRIWSLALFRAQDQIRTIHTRHEQGAAYMALGAALATGKASGLRRRAGAGPAQFGGRAVTAYGMNAPALALVGQIPMGAIGRGLGHLHEMNDQRGILVGLVDHSAPIRECRPQHATLVAEAFHAMRRGRPGPRCLECPMDVWGQAFR